MPCSLLNLFVFLLPIFMPSAIVECSVENFAPEVEWTCSPESIQVLVHTPAGFRGLIHPRGVRPPFPVPANCTVRGTGEQDTWLEIPLNGDDDGSSWDSCGLEFEPMSSTLWTMLEIHEHPLLVLDQDRTVNISCAGWTGRNDGDEKSPFQMALLPSSLNNSSSLFGPFLNTVFFGSHYNLSILANQSYGQNTVRVHSCMAISADGHTKLQLIDSDGCSTDLRLMDDMMVTSATQSTVYTDLRNLPTIWPRRITVATARIPSMFRFNNDPNTNEKDNSANNRKYSNPNHNAIRFECTVERCGDEDNDSGQDGKSTTTMGPPCPKADCNTKRIVAQQHGDDDVVEQQPPPPEMAPKDMELVRQILGGGEEHGPIGEEEEDEGDPGSGQTPNPNSGEDGFGQFGNEQTEGIQKSGTTTNGAPWQLLQQQNGTSREQKTTTTQQKKLTTTTNKPIQKATTTLAPPKAQKRHQNNAGGQRVGTSVRVVNAEEPETRKKDKDKDADGKKDNAERTTKEPSTTPASTVVATIPEAETDEEERANSNNKSVYPTLLPGNISSSSSSDLRNSSTISASTSSPTSAVPLLPNSAADSAAVSPDQLLLLFQLCLALCALFLLGCCCNLLICCCLNRRRGGSLLQSPFRNKRGRRQQQVVVGPALGHNSHTTLTSSLYGNTNEVVNTKNGGPKSSQQVGFWISDNGGPRNGATTSGDPESEQYAPMMSSLYGDLSSSINNANNNCHQNPNHRRSSVHSYASVKQRVNPQMLCKMPMTEIQNGAGVVARQQQQQSSSTSPPSHSPSTTTSSTSGGGFSSSGGGGGTSYHSEQGQNSNQQHTVSSIYHHRPSTFHPPSSAVEQHPSSNSVASSVRSSATLDGGGSAPGASPPYFTVDDHEHDADQQRQDDMEGGMSTPRPEQHQYPQQHNHANKTSTFGRRPTHQQQQQESFSIL